MSAEMVGRPVRVTLEGTARPATKRRLEVTSAAGGVLLVDPHAAGVAVEYLEAERAWTDGDVVSAQSGTVWCRVAGKWHHVAEHGIATAYDSTMAAVLADGGTVHRYQAGDL